MQKSLKNAAKITITTLRELQFDDFTKSNFYQPQKFNSSEIKSIAFVAFGKDFDAQLDIIEAELF